MNRQSPNRVILARIPRISSSSHDESPEEVPGFELSSLGRIVSRPLAFKVLAASVLVLVALAIVPSVFKKNSESDSSQTATAETPPPAWQPAVRESPVPLIPAPNTAPANMPMAAPINAPVAASAGSPPIDTPFAASTPMGQAMAAPNVAAPTAADPSSMFPPRLPTSPVMPGNSAAPVAASAVSPARYSATPILPSASNNTMAAPIGTSSASLAGVPMQQAAVNAPMQSAAAQTSTPWPNPSYPVSASQSNSVTPQVSANQAITINPNENFRNRYDSSRPGVH